ncbi:MAG: hypothetical protein ABIX28_26155 [Vicinamibacterales bacterium]
MAPFDIRPFARIGAQARLDELQAERDSILRAFPDLGQPGAPVKADRAAARSAGAAAKPGRKAMSAAEKKAVSERMRRYWAGRRAAKAAAAAPAQAPDATSKPATAKGRGGKGGRKKR